MNLKPVALGVFLYSGVALTSFGAVIAGWSFDGASPLTPSSGSGTLTPEVPYSTPTSGGNPNGYLTFTDSEFHGPFVIQVSGTGQSGFAVAYDAKYTTAASTVNWYYSTDGNSWTSYGSGQALSSSWGNYSIDFSGATALNNSAAVYFQAQFTERSAFDNLSVTAVPEPANVAMAVFAVLGFSAEVVRRLRVRRA